MLFAQFEGTSQTLVNVLPSFEERRVVGKRRVLCVHSLAYVVILVNDDVAVLITPLVGWCLGEAFEWARCWWGPLDCVGAQFVVGDFGEFGRLGDDWCVGVGDRPCGRCVVVGCVDGGLVDCEWRGDEAIIVFAPVEVTDCDIGVCGVEDCVA